MTDKNHPISVDNSLSRGTIYPLDRGSLNFMAQESEIIGYFIQGQQQTVANEDLKLEYTATSIRLSDVKAQLIGISKQVNKWQRKVLISNNSVYKTKLITALIGAGFIARQKSSHPEFTEYHYYQVPAGYRLNYTEVIQLWRTWWHTKRYQLNVAAAPIDLSIFNKGNWYPVQDLQPKQGSFIIFTARGEMAIEAAEYITWIDSADQPSIAQAEANMLSQTIASPLTDNSILKDRANFTQSNRVERSSAPEEYIDLEAYLSTFNTEDSEDVGQIESIYNIDRLLSSTNPVDELPPPPPKPLKLASPAKIEATSTPAVPPVVAPRVDRLPAPSVSQRQAALKQKAIDVLATYVAEGDTIMRAEVLKNAQGQEINRKVTRIHRDCPSWAIEQIKKLGARG